MSEEDEFAKPAKIADYISRTWRESVRVFRFQQAELTKRLVRCDAIRHGLRGADISLSEEFHDEIRMLKAELYKIRDHLDDLEVVLKTKSAPLHPPLPERTAHIANQLNILRKREIDMYKKALKAASEEGRPFYLELLDEATGSHQRR